MTTEDVCEQINEVLGEGDESAHEVLNLNPSANDMDILEGTEKTTTVEQTAGLPVIPKKALPAAAEGGDATGGVCPECGEECGGTCWASQRFLDELPNTNERKDADEQKDDQDKDGGMERMDTTDQTARTEEEKRDDPLSNHQVEDREQAAGSQALVAAAVTPSSATDTDSSPSSSNRFKVEVWKGTAPRD